MTGNRSILELLKLLLSHSDRIGKGKETSLCSLIEGLYTVTYINGPYINKDEFIMLSNYMQSSRPHHLSKWDYWWPKYEVQPRIDWLNMQIQILENDGK